MPRDSWINLVTALATIGAAVVPLYLFLVERSDRIRTQKALDEELADRARSEQARAQERLLSRVRQVAVWRSTAMVIIQGATYPSGENVTVPSAVVHVANHGDGPIFDVRPKAGQVRGEGLEVVKPGEEREVTIPVPDRALLKERSCSVIFSDTEGRRWCRHSSGAVESLEPVVDDGPERQQATEGSRVVRRESDRRDQR